MAQRLMEELDSDKNGILFEIPKASGSGPIFFQDFLEASTQLSYHVVGEGGRASI